MPSLQFYLLISLLYALRSLPSPALPKGCLMLALVATLLGAPDAGAALEPSQPLPRRACISTAVETKSVQCNQDCNADGAQCPLACVCSEPTETSADLSLEMPSPERYTALVDRFSDEAHEPTVTSLDRRKLPATMAAAKVPSEALGYCEFGLSPRPPQPRRTRTHPRRPARIGDPWIL